MSIRARALRMTIPIDVARALDINEGDIVEVGITDSQMIVKKASRARLNDNDLTEFVRIVLMNNLSCSK